MKSIYNFFCSLKFIFMPHYWLMLGTYSQRVDEKITHLAEENDFEPINITRYNNGKCFYVKLGNAYYWVANYPYSFFVEEFPEKTKLGLVKMYPRSTKRSFRPSRLTISGLYKKLQDDLAKHNLQHA